MLNVGGRGDVKGKVLSSPCCCVSSSPCIIVAVYHCCCVSLSPCVVVVLSLLSCPCRLLSWPHPHLVSSLSSHVHVMSLCQVVVVLCLSKVNWDKCGMGDTHCDVRD